MCHMYSTIIQTNNNEHFVCCGYFSVLAPLTQLWWVAYLQ